PKTSRGFAFIHTEAGRERDSDGLRDQSRVLNSLFKLNISLSSPVFNVGMRHAVCMSKDEILHLTHTDCLNGD
uniref:Uncharacterized protein n=1 Tax=Echeneis naucrates TaxID=173247 RepID=A0A665VIL5_ECHNA